MIKISDQDHIMYSAAILLVLKLLVWGHNKTRTAPSPEFVHEENRHGVHRHTHTLETG